MEDWKDYLSKIAKDTGRGIKGYVKAQMMLMGITFLIIFVGLNVIDIPYAFVIALGISLLDIVPMLGTGIVMIPWAILSFISGNTQMGTGVAILFVTQFILRQIIEPIIVGDQIGIRPIYTFVATILGSILLGPFGIILGPIIAILMNSVSKASKNK